MDASARRGYSALIVLLGVMLFATHWRPALAWPLQGVWTALAVLGLAGLAFLTGKRLGIQWEGAASPAWVLVLFSIWGWLRTVTGINQTEGLLDVSGYLNGLLFFGLGVFVVRGGESLGNGEPSRNQWGIRVVSILFWVLSVSIAIHGILEYHLYFPQQLAEQRTSGVWNPTDVVEGAILLALTEMRVRSLFGNPNVLCGFFAFTYPLLVAAAWDMGRLKTLSRLQHRLIALAFVLSSLTIFYTAFRTGSVGGGFVLLTGLALIGVTGFVWRLKQKRQQVAFPITLIGGIFLALFYLGPTQARLASQPLLSSPTPVSVPFAENTSSTTTVIENEKEPFWKKIRQGHTIPQRLYYCRIGLRIWQDAPLLGHGLSGYQTLYLKYRQPGEGETRYAHNFVVQLLADTGLVGLGLFSWFLALLALRLWRGMRTGQMTALWLATGAAVFLFLLDSLGEYTFCTREGYQDFALLAGVFCASSPGKKTPPASPLFPFQQPILLTIGGALILICFWTSTIRPFMARYYLQNADNAIQEMEWIERSEHRPLSSEPMSLNEWRQEALDSIQKAIQWFPKSSESFQKRAALYRMARQEELAERDLLNACRLDPYSASLRAQLAECVWRQGRREEALELIEQAITRHPVKSPHYLQRARYLEAMDRISEARECVEQAERLAFMPQEKTEAQLALKRIKTGNR